MTLEDQENQEDAPARFADVIRVSAFRVLFGAELQSVIGDQLARVALSVLVFARTGSDSATALTYGLTYLPALLGGFVLSRVGDRWPRKRVMVVCDALRAVMFAVMAIPGLPLPAVGALLVVAVFVGPAFGASAVSLLANLLTPSQFRTASGLRMTTNQLAQVVGFAVGGLVTGVLGVHRALLLNALTYLLSAVVLLFGLAHASRAAAGADAGSEPPPSDRPGVRVLTGVMRHGRTRAMLLLSLLAGVFIAPESLAVPFAAQVGASTTQAGLLLAAIPLGSAMGVLFFVRIVRNERRRGTARTMAVATGLPLVVTAVHPDLGLAAACWFASGFAAAYQVEVFVGLIRDVPDERRAQLVSVAGALLLGAQGIGPLVFGVVASSSTPALAVSIAGALGSAAALVIVASDRSGVSQPRHRAPS